MNPRDAEIARLRRENAALRRGAEAYRLAGLMVGGTTDVAEAKADGLTRTMRYLADTAIGCPTCLDNQIKARDALRGRYVESPEYQTPTRGERGPVRRDLYCSSCGGTGWDSYNVPCPHCTALTAPPPKLIEAPEETP